MEPDHHRIAEPSEWVRRFLPLVAQGGKVLDLACGGGRHARLFAALGYAVEAVDRDAAALAQLAHTAGVTTRCADLERASWPYASERFAGIVVVNYLHRPLLPAILDVLAQDGVLIYETFMRGNERFGRPSNPDFLLRADELLEWVRGRLQIVAFEQGMVRLPQPAMAQRLCAVNGAGPNELPE